mgnify:CR=1 FL=1
MKKISLIIPFMLLTSTLTSCNHVDPFQISADKFNEAVTFSSSNLQHVQRSWLSGVVAGISSLNYFEEFISPNIYSKFYRKIESSSHNPKPEKSFDEKANDGKYYSYTEKEGGGWKKEEITEESYIFPKPSNFTIKGILDYGSVTYDTIKNSYDKDRQAYYIDTMLGSYPYTIAMAFYNNRLTYFSYEYYNDDQGGLTRFGTMAFTYGNITPELPDVPDIQ